MENLASFSSTCFMTKVNEDDANTIQPVFISSDQHHEDVIKTGNDRPGQFDIWTSILAQKAQTQEPTSANLDSFANAPYIHPLVKRSSSSLSEKSLQICTESLGSETGSDGFSSYPPSEACSEDGDQEEEQLQQQQHQQDEKHQVRCAYKYSEKLAPTKSFPPPLTSLSQVDAPSTTIRMQSRRGNGRLVLEVVSIPTQNYFNAQRQDGRLLLTFAKNPNTNQEVRPERVEEEEEAEQLCDDEVNVFEKGISGTANKVVEMGIVAATNEKAAVRVLGAPRIMNNFNKVIRLDNQSPPWLKFDDQDTESEPAPNSNQIPNSKQVQKSISPRMVAPRLIPSTFNAYENSWRSKKAGTYFNSPHVQKAPPLKNNKNMVNWSKMSSEEKAKEEQKMVIMRGGGGGGEINGCKETRRKPILFWEPHRIINSIATS